jgi:hypothetical protein
MITCIIKFKKEFYSFYLEKINLYNLVFGIDLYKKNEKFIEKYITDFSEKKCVDFLPTEQGSIFIDLEKNIIIDNQILVGINKITPIEIRSSYNKKDKQIFERFCSLVENNYLVKFEIWNDSGHHNDSSKIKMSLDDLIYYINNSNDYGQFIFSTFPFTVETFIGSDWLTSKKLFERLKTVELLPDESHKKWENFLSLIKK